MNLVFRADSSIEIGTGHIMRCLSLCDQLKIKATFVSRELEGHVCDKIEEAGHKLIRLPKIDLRIEQPIQNLDEEFEAIRYLKADVLIVDHYGAYQEWERRMRPLCKKLVAVDDLNRPHEVDAIIDQNYYNQTPSEYAKAKTSIGTKLFVGPEYALLHPKFVKTGRTRKFFNEDLNLIMFFGGSDLHLVTYRMLPIIDQIQEKINWHIIVGKQNQKREEIEDFCGERDNVNFHFNIDYMQELMEQCDLFIGSGGTISWERAFYGVPAIVLSVAHNQEQLCKELHQQGAIHYLGDQSNIDNKKVVAEINKMIADRLLRMKASEAAYALNVGSKVKDLKDYLLK